MAYRTPARRDENEEARKPHDVGALISKHGRGSGLTRLIGESSIAGVDLHTKGLVVHDADEGPTDVAFEDIDAMHFEVDGLIPGPPRIILLTFDERRAVIPRDLLKLDVVMKALDREVTEPLIANATEALARGERLVFGPVVLVLDGIELFEKSLPWGELAWVAAEPDSIVFYANEPRGRFGWAPLADLPHPRVLLEVLRRRTQIVPKGMRLFGLDRK